MHGDARLDAGRFKSNYSKLPETRQQALRVGLGGGMAGCGLVDVNLVAATAVSFPHVEQVVYAVQFFDLGQDAAPVATEFLRDLLGREDELLPRLAPCHLPDCGKDAGGGEPDVLVP